MADVVVVPPPLPPPQPVPLANAVEIGDTNPPPAPPTTAIDSRLVRTARAARYTWLPIGCSYEPDCQVQSQALVGAVATTHRACATPPVRPERY